MLTSRKDLKVRIDFAGAIVVIAASITLAIWMHRTDDTYSCLRAPCPPLLIGYPVTDRLAVVAAGFLVGGLIIALARSRAGTTGKPDRLGWPAQEVTLGGNVGDWRQRAGDVKLVLRRGWRAAAAVLLVTTVLPMLPVSGLIAVSVAVGVAIGSDGQDSGVILALAIVTAPFLLLLVAGCGLLVARGWTGAVWAAASAGPGRPAGVPDALRWSERRSRPLWGCYLAGVAVLGGAAYLAGYAAPHAFTVPDLLVLAGPTALVAALGFGPSAVWRQLAPGAREAPAVQDAAVFSRRRGYLAPMAVVLAVVTGSQAAVALVLSWLLTSPWSSASGVGLNGINGPAAAFIANAVALPGLVLMACFRATSLSGSQPPRLGRPS